MARKKGDTKGSGKSRLSWNGRRWVPAPVKAAAKTTTPKRTRAQNRRSSSGSAVKNATSGTRKTPLKTIPASKRPKDMQSGKVYGDAGQPKAPKLPPKPSPKPSPKPAPKPAPKPSPKPAPKAPAKKAPAAKKPAPKAATAANARSLRSGPTPPKPKAKPRSWLRDNYKPGGPAKGAVKVKPKRLTNKQRKQGGYH